uniref:RxLR effector protein n=1 Tax=Craspedostauros australis TaxID=1486917 RepID=A0A7R9WQ66_9STRA|mmetsp:Transcript_13113/g.36223  ORF Transcript_13113/g.36223 Transcript_13113/m.36223 type:complete len:129 (+) Transcript_13113:239-625(+)|eukprot:CAMPEP_0198115886 /NCGR_PEP_ID=MMETSP1442-20131203/7921_1 /TAXON_ID= /ORGANISM="Craspedostauros australis, Strain CCMP3328" /LENGTH=128 /DNA_ID=CAMNT_0043773483 /DNA_START=185 /DNA_END=571 /DNA_ORIENTATION=+
MRILAITIVSAASFASVNAFSPTIPLPSSPQVASTTNTQLNGLFDFHSFHGGGSAKEDDLDEQWRVQQEILAARRGHMTKDHLYNKYGHAPGTSQSTSPQAGKVESPQTPKKSEPAKAKKESKFFWEK